MIHLVGLPHTSFDANRFAACAYTAKAVRTVRMLRSVNRDVTVYWGGEGSNFAGQSEVVSCMSDDEQADYWGPWSAGNLPNIIFDGNRPEWQIFNARVIAATEERFRPGDVIAVAMGTIHQPVINHFLDRAAAIVEIGVGYEGLASNTFACFESYAWMHHIYGQWRIGDGRAFDTVIPNVVYEDEWNEPEPSEEYALFVGRLIWRKGPVAAVEIAKRAGLKLVMAGAGVATQKPGRIVATDGTVIEGGHVTHVGAVSGQARRDLFARAKVLICPTLYIGPWEGVHAEAMMSGVPVVAPDYGVFTETLPEQQRYRNVSQAVEAIKSPVWPRGAAWRDHAIDICGHKVCTRKYDDWFKRLETLSGGGLGWYA